MLRVRLIATLVALFVLAAPVAAAPAPKPGEDDRPWSNTQPLTPPPAAGGVDAAALVFPATLTGTPSAKIPAFDGGSSFLCDATDCRSLVYRGTTYQLHTVSGSGVMTVATVAGLTGADTIYYETMNRFGTTLIAFGFRMVGETPGYGIYRSIDKGLTWTFAEKFDADDYVYASRCLSATVCLLPVAEVDAATETLVYAIYRTADKGATWTKLSMPASFADLSGVTTFECIPGTGCLMIATTTDAGTGDDVVRAFTSSAAATSWVAVNTLPAALDGAAHILCDGTACAAIHVVSVEDYSAYGHYEIYVATTSFSTWTKRPDIATEQYYPYIMETTCSPILCAFTTDDPMAVRAAGASGTWTADTTATDLTKATDGSAIYSCNATFCVTYRGPRVERMTAPRTTPVQTLVAATISLWNETWSCADALAAAPFCAMSWMTPDWKMAAARSTDGFGTMEIISFSSALMNKFGDLQLLGCPDAGCLYTLSSPSGSRRAIYRTTNGTSFTLVSGSKAIAGLSNSMSCSGKVCTMTHSSSKILRSTDAGLTWKMSATGPDDGLSTVASCGGTTCLSVAGPERELYRSADGGTVWAEIDLSPYIPTGSTIIDMSHAGCSSGLKLCFLNFALENTATETIENRLYRFGATGAGTLITPPGAGPDSGIGGVIAGGAGTILLYADGYELFRSTNSGATWSNVSSGLSGKFDLEAYYWTIDWSGTKATIFGINGATQKAQVFRSADGLAWAKGVGSSSR